MKTEPIHALYVDFEPEEEAVITNMIALIDKIIDFMSVNNFYTLETSNGDPFDSYELSSIKNQLRDLETAERFVE